MCYDDMTASAYICFMSHNSFSSGWLTAGLWQLTAGNQTISAKSDIPATSATATNTEYQSSYISYQHRNNHNKWSNNITLEYRLYIGLESINYVITAPFCVSSTVWVSVHFPAKTRDSKYCPPPLPLPATAWSVWVSVWHTTTMSRSGLRTRYYTIIFEHGTWDTTYCLIVMIRSGFETCNWLWK